MIEQKGLAVFNKAVAETITNLEVYDKASNGFKVRNLGSAKSVSFTWTIINTSYNGTKWLYIQVTLNGVQYTGFSSKTYLKKQ